MHIGEFDTLPPAQAAQTVAVWAAIPAWTDAVVAGRPYGSVDAAAEAAAMLSLSWTEGDLEAALAHHPRIGQRPDGAGAEVEASRSEQASMSSAAEETTVAIADANAAYEERFGRVFLVRAAGRSPEDMLAEARRRLGNDDATETTEALGQLREIALLRLRTTLTAD